MLVIPRRRFLQGLAALVAAPAIVRFESLMPVHALPIEEFIQNTEWQWYRDGVPIIGATLPTYALADGDCYARLSLTHKAGIFDRIVANG